MDSMKIKDALDRPLRDLRISVIDRCNFRCQYCMPAEIFNENFHFLPRNELLSYEEIERLAKIFASLGVEKLRLTGGEPLLRKELPVLIEKLSKEKNIKLEQIKHNNFRIKNRISTNNIIITMSYRITNTIYNGFILKIIIIVIKIIFNT